MKSIDKIPLTAIETPRVSDHEGNNARNNPPKYSFGASMSFPIPLISEPPPPTPINEVAEYFPKNKVSHKKSDPLKASIHGIDNPNLSEDSENDQAPFERSRSSPTCENAKLSSTSQLPNSSSVSFPPFT